MISVIIPTYNREKTIRRSVESVLRQTYTDFEVIVVDDASSDRTEEVVEAINDVRVRFIRLDKNGGACRARNIGISIAKGEYIAFNDSDDVWMPNKLANQLAFLLKCGADVVSCQMMQHFLNGKKKCFPVTFPKGFLSQRQLFLNSMLSTQLILGKSECFKTCLFDERLPRLQDFELSIRLAADFKVAIQEEVLVEQYFQENSITFDTQKSIVALDVIADKYEAVIKQDKIIEASIWKKRGFFVMLNRQNPCVDFFNSLKAEFSIKVLILFFISLCGLSNIFVKYRYGFLSKRK